MWVDKFYVGLDIWRQNTACKARLLEGNKKKEAMIVYGTYLHCVITVASKQKFFTVI